MIEIVLNVIKINLIESILPTNIYLSIFLSRSIELMNNVKSIQHITFWTIKNSLNCCAGLIATTSNFDLDLWKILEKELSFSLDKHWVPC